MKYFLTIQDWNDYKLKFQDWILGSGSAITEVSNLLWEKGWAREMGVKMYRTSVVHLDVEDFSEELLWCLLCHKEPARSKQKAPSRGLFAFQSP